MQKSSQFLQLSFLSLMVLLSSCSPAENLVNVSVQNESNNPGSEQVLEEETVNTADPELETEVLPNATASPTQIPIEPTQTLHPSWTATPDTRLLPHQWRSWPSPDQGSIA